MPAIMDKFGGIAGLVGFSSSGSSSLTQFMVLLNSDTLAEQVVTRLNLIEILNKGEVSGGAAANGDQSWIVMEKAVRNLKGVVKLFDDRKLETITVSAIMDDPQLAAHVVNAYIEKLRKIIDDNSLTVAKRNRVFIEEQIKKNKKEYFASWRELNDYYETGKVADLDASTGFLREDGHEAPSMLDFEMTELEKVLQGDGVQSQLNDMNAKTNEVDRKLRSAVLHKRLSPQVYVRYLTLHNNLLGQTGALLAQQYEMAKIEEAKNDLAFQVVDPARVPTRRCYPHRAAMVVQAFVVALLLSMVVVIFAEYIHKIKNQVPHAK